MTFIYDFDLCFFCNAQSIVSKPRFKVYLSTWSELWVCIRLPEPHDYLYCQVWWRILRLL